ncbi:MAG: hypothetical protein ACK4OJ_03960 [Brevundimonas sp.]
MADHVLTLPLTDEALERLKSAARRAGIEPEAYAVAILDRALTDDVSGVRENDAAFDANVDAALAGYDLARRHDKATHALPPEGPTAAEALAEYDRTGVYETFEEWSTAFETDLKARLDARR